MMLLFLIIPWLFRASQSVPVNANRPIDVCTVLNHLSEYRTKFIAVRGMWDGPDIVGDCGPVSKTELNRIGLPYEMDRIFQIHPYERGLDSLADWSEDGKSIDAAYKKYEG